MNSSFDLTKCTCVGNDVTIRICGYTTTLVLMFLWGRNLFMHSTVKWQPGINRWSKCQLFMFTVGPKDQVLMVPGINHFCETLSSRVWVFNYIYRLLRRGTINHGHLQWKLLYYATWMSSKLKHILVLQ